MKMVLSSLFLNAQSEVFLFHFFFVRRLEK